MMAQSPFNAPRARAAYIKPQHPTDPLNLPSPRETHFLHPGYPDDDSLLLSLPALDSPDGIHHQTALDVCALVAGNRWDGFFTLDKDGKLRVPTDNMDASLHGKAYYFHVPAEDSDNPGIRKDYPIVPTFTEWKFPHNTLPARWSREPTFEPADVRRCLLSKSISLLEIAHIIPRDMFDEKWFNDNGMLRYDGIHSNRNIMTLKVDVHQYFDRKPKFVIVQKYGKMVAHFLRCRSAEEREPVELYHNVPVAIAEQHHCFLLARLAWTVFPLIELFLKKGVSRRLLRKTGEGVEVVEENARRCIQAFLDGQPRSASPTKRARKDNGEAQDACDWGSQDASGWESQDVSDWESQDASDWEEQLRGRKRRRELSVCGTQHAHLISGE
ncbi:hypothetical protein FOPE_10495 [Fonsecaea pedrosoi]|nr:hypothetical protein FOPE_10495 [Fonsecaea pedrosoi]